MGFEVDVKLWFKTQLQRDATELMLRDMRYSWGDVLRMGIQSLEQKKDSFQLINEMDTHLDAYFYLRQTRNEKGARAWNISKVLLEKGKCKNYQRVKIYEMTKLTETQVIILYTDSETNQGEFKSVKKIIKDVDLLIMKKFFGSHESRGFNHTQQWDKK
jgi:hypothetical protein